MESREFKIFRSSAGSGKTYRLALEYLKLALIRPDYYSRILAVTFTNKATNEMKARIIEFLFKLARGEGDDTLVAELEEALNMDALQLQERAKKTLHRILHGYSQFSVSTIDSFFQRVIRAFSRDLGIQGGYDLEFDLESVKDYITDRLFLQLDSDPDLKKWLTRFAVSKIESSKHWDIQYDIRQMSGQIFFESFNRFYEAISDRISDTNQLSEVLKEINRERKKIQENIESVGAEGLRMIADCGLDISDFARGIHGPAGLFYKINKGMPVNLSSSYLLKPLEDPEGWYAKASTKKGMILDALESGLQSKYQETYDFLKKEFIKENTYIEVQKNFYHLGILKNLIEGIKEYREINNTVLISDLSNLLKAVIGENDAPFVYEKVGSFYRHFLIDEFQDTSGFQWDNFLPLVLNSLSMGHMNMIVGDVKQSIYRWRGGDWEILQSQVNKDTGQFPVKYESLADNWRSQRNIVYFNNLLFSSLTGILKHKFRTEIDALSLPGSAVPIPDFSERFQEAYKDVHQYLPENKTYPADGMVEISFVPNSIQAGRKVSWKDMVLPELVDRICKLQDEGYDANDIAILVRTKEEGRKIANYLLDHKRHNETTGHYNFDVISSESLFLKSSPAVNAIMYFIKLVLDLEDRIAAINFYYWLTHLKSGNKHDDWDKVFRDACSEDGQQKLNQKILGGMERIDFSEYRALPLTDLIEEISLLLNLDRHSQEQSYVLGLQNVVLEYLTKNHNDLHAFIEWWFEEGQNKSLKPSMEQNSIRILTIHQSKGLQFKQVLLPFCSWEIDHSSNNENILWASIKLPVLEQIPVYPLRYSSQLGKSYFAEAYFREKSLAYMDNLNLLYVALTRAENGLFVFAEAPDNPDREKTVGDLIQLFLQNPEEADSLSMEQEQLNIAEFWNQEKGIFRLGNISRPAIVDHAQITYSLEDFERGSWHHKIRIRRQADILDSSQEGIRGEKINYGILLHDLLAGIKTKEDLSPLLTQLVNTGNIAQNDAHRLTEMMHDLWKNEKIADWFSGKWKIKTEAPVLPDKAQVRRMDRVMIRDETAIVVDYKTGAKRPAHIDQVKDYKNILCRMGYVHVEGYVLYINNGELIRV